MSLVDKVKEWLAASLDMSKVSVRRVRETTGVWIKADGSVTKIKIPFDEYGRIMVWLVTESKCAEYHCWNIQRYACVVRHILCGLSLCACSAGLPWVTRITFWASPCGAMTRSRG